MMSMIKSRPVFDTLKIGLRLAKPYRTPLLHDFPPSNLPVCNLKEKQTFPSVSSSLRLPKYHKKHSRDFTVYSGPGGVPPSSGPPNILSWIVGLTIAVVVPLVSYRWGPSLKNKIEAALQVTEDVAEAVEKVAEDVEKVAEDISDNLPPTGKLREAADFVEDFAERVAKDAGAVDDFIDQVQDNEEKAESVVESVKETFDKSNGQDAKDQN